MVARVVVVQVGLDPEALLVRHLPARVERADVTAVLVAPRTRPQRPHPLRGTQKGADPHARPSATSKSSITEGGGGGATSRTDLPALHAHERVCTPVQTVLRHDVPVELRLCDHARVGHTVDRQRIRKRRLGGR